MKVLNNIKARFAPVKLKYSFKAGKVKIAQNMEFYGGVWKVSFNGFSVDYYANREGGVVVYMLTKNSIDTGKGIVFYSADEECRFIVDHIQGDNGLQKMMSLIEFIENNSSY